MLAPSVPVLDKWKERLVVVCEVLGKAVVPERKAFRRLAAWHAEFIIVGAGRRHLLPHCYRIVVGGPCAAALMRVMLYGRHIMLMAGIAEVGS